MIDLKNIKICGIKNKPTLNACIEIGVGFIGFNFVKQSPRYIPLNECVDLTVSMPKTVAKVALVVNETLENITHIIQTLQPNYIQLHGAETPEFIQELKHKTGIKIIKAIGIAKEHDIKTANLYSDIADIILFDTKIISDNNTLTGGHGQTFNWGLLSNIKNLKTPLMLAGGLNYHNLNMAQKQTTATYFDICSGVEESKGEKSVRLIEQLKKLKNV